jgi:putative transposase
MTNAVVEQALFQAVVIQRPPADLIHPSDRGSQYCSPRYQRILKQFGMTASMSRRGNCYDNAPMENFWGTLKRGLVASRLSRRSPNTSRFFYNRQRRYSRPRYLSPAAFAQQYYYRTQQAA